MTAVDTSEAATVVTSDSERCTAGVFFGEFPGLTDMSTVDISNTATVGNSPVQSIPKDWSSAVAAPIRVEMTTVAIGDLSTVRNDDGGQGSEVPASHDRTDMSTVVIGDLSTVRADERGQGREALTANIPIENYAGAASNPSIADRPQRRSVVLWITDHGDLVPEGRVKQIRLAQDVISSAEESVYDTLWNLVADVSPVSPFQTDERDRSGLVQAGYDYLVKRTGLSKRTIQRIVEKLIEKDFIAIERPADIYRRASTVYRVFSHRTVLDRHLRKGRSHVAKLGPGFSYVRPLEDPGWPASTRGLL
jgi:hypothetical protein